MAKARPRRPASKPGKRPDQRRTLESRWRRWTAWLRWLSLANLTLAGAAVGLAFVVTWDVFGGARFDGQPLDEADIRALVERIVTVESGGDASLKNKHSSATGAGQFTDDTWMEAVRRHRHDLVEGRTDKEILELRRAPPCMVNWSIWWKRD